MMVISASRYALAYLFWAISVAGAIAILLASRSSVMIVLGLTPWDRYFEHAINQFGFLFLAIFGLSVIVFTEHFYRTGVEKKRLFSRFFLITLLELLFLSFVHLVRVVGIGIFTPDSLILLGGELVLALIAFLLYRRTSQQSTAPTP
jgi:hypothetical protein